jgi:hypothetical protein
MIRTLTVAFGIAIAASAVAAEEFVVVINDVFAEAGVTDGTTSVPGAPTIVTESSDETLAVVARARGEDGTYLNITPFN